MIAGNETCPASAGLKIPGDISRGLVFQSFRQDEACCLFALINYLSGRKHSEDFDIYPPDSGN